MSIEIWKKIEGTNGKYSVSNHGRIKRSKGEQESILKGYPNSGGYLSFTARVEGKTKRMLVHRLVAEYFLEPVEGKIYVNHKDQNKMNANVENLEWITQRDNMIHARKNRKTSSKYTGVVWMDGYKKWVSKIGYKGEVIMIGKYDDEYEAHKAYIKKAKELGLDTTYMEGEKNPMERVIVVCKDYEDFLNHKKDSNKQYTCMCNQYLLSSTGFDEYEVTEKAKESPKYESIMNRINERVRHNKKLRDKYIDKS